MGEKRSNLTIYTHNYTGMYPEDKQVLRIKQIEDSKDKKTVPGAERAGRSLHRD